MGKEAIQGKEDIKVVQSKKSKLLKIAKIGEELSENISKEVGKSLKKILQVQGNTMKRVPITADSVWDSHQVTASKNPLALVEAITSVVGTFNAMDEQSITRNIENAVREAGYTGTKVHRQVVDAIIKWNESMEILQEVAEMAKEDHEEHLSFLAEQEASQEEESSEEGFDVDVSPSTEEDEDEDFDVNVAPEE